MTSPDHFNVVFEKPLVFSGATFEGRRNFNHALFKEKADFSGVTFKEMVSFSDAIFKKEADFSGAIFEERADFSGATFKEKANFAGATFNETVCFGFKRMEQPYEDGSRPIRLVRPYEAPGAIFEKEADFEGATFEERTDFEKAIFEERTDFTNVVFEQLPTFGEATFECRPYFQDTRFAAGADDFEKWIMRLAAIASLTGYDLRDLLERSGHSVGNVRDTMEEVSAKGKEATNTGKQIADRWSNEARDLFDDFVEASKSNTESTENGVNEEDDDN